MDVERWHPESNASFSPKYLGPNLLLFSEMERSRTVLIADVDCTVPPAAFIVAVFSLVICLMRAKKREDKETQQKKISKRKNPQSWKGK